MKVGENARLVCNTQSEPILENTSQIAFTNYTGRLKSATVERTGNVRALVKLEGIHRSDTGREWLPFVVPNYYAVFFRSFFRKELFGNLIRLSLVLL